MKRLFYAAACAAIMTCTGAAAQQRAGSAEGGISAEMLAEISKGYEGKAADKAVKNALFEMKEGKFEIYLPDEEGYEDSTVDVIDYVEPKEEFKPFKIQEVKASEASESFDDFDSKDLMDADEVFTNEEGFTVADAEEE